MLIFALVLVYLFSIQRLPLDTPHLKSLGAFLNIGAAGFVMAALGLRFTFPSISLEGKSFWVVRAAPLGVPALMAEKFMLSAIPMCVLGGGIVAVTNWLLAADAFIGWLTFFSMLLITLTLCGMGVGFGAIFPKFHVENIHQIESSAGGFAYMACALGYIGLMVALESWIVQNHFWIKFGKLPGWDWTLVGWTLGAVGVLNVIAFAVPWLIGRRLLESYEG
jgi:ABC-2 type transport system permease protein